jgi:DNA replication and repair protein RecF
VGLKITSFEFQNFRNYHNYRLSEVGDLTLFIGPNAVGKTNLIEGLQLCTACTSFRNPKVEHLVRMGASGARVSVSIGDGNRDLLMELLVREGKKEYRLNGKRKQARSLRGLLPAILFCPDDLTLVKGSMSVKRAQLDALGSQLSPNYHSVRRDYERIIQQKNRYLKDEVSHAYLQSINEVVAQVGAQFHVLRARLANELSPYISRYYRQISACDEEVSIAYVPSWVHTDAINVSYVGNPVPDREQVREQLIAVMEGNHAHEHNRRHALYGPHADKLVFFLDGHDAGVFASQGQQRSIVLAVKMAEVALVRDRLNQSPILLLDDVMSELDSNRRSALLSCIPDDVQTFVSSTNLDYFDGETLERATVIHLGANHG